MSKLRKRNYPALEVTGTGKWFTGWEDNAFTEERWEAFQRRYPNADYRYVFEGNSPSYFVDIIEHETRKLSLQFSHTEKGRSSAVAVFEDKDGFKYKVSFSNLELILQLLHRKRDPNTKYDISETRIQGSGTWIEGTFMQVKKGQNYFIEPVEVN